MGEPCPVPLPALAPFSPEQRWKQLNSAYAMAKGLGLLKTDRGEMKVFQTWARLKEKADSQAPKA